MNKHMFTRPYKNTRRTGKGLREQKNTLSVVVWCDHHLLGTVMLLAVVVVCTRLPAPPCRRAPRPMCSSALVCRAAPHHSSPECLALARRRRIFVVPVRAWTRRDGGI